MRKTFFEKKINPGKFHNLQLFGKTSCWPGVSKIYQLLRSSSFLTLGRLISPKRKSWKKPVIVFYEKFPQARGLYNYIIKRYGSVICKKIPKIYATIFYGTLSPLITESSS